MRILFICPYTWEYGGPPKVVFDLSEVFISDNNNDVTILSVNLKGQQSYPLANGAQLILFKGSFLSKFWAFFSFELLYWLIKNAKNYDIIHVHGIWHFPSIVPFFVKTQAKIIISVHGMLEPWGLNKGALKKKVFSFLFQKRLLKKSDLIHVLKKSEKDDVQHYLGEALDYIKVIPNGLKLKEDNIPHLRLNESFRKKYGFDSEPLILFMGRINEKKGILILLTAFVKICAINKDVKLVIAGADDGFLKNILAFIEEYNLKDRVIYTGMLVGNLKEAALLDATIFVLPSYSEGFSIAALEALYAGLPCCFSENIGFSEVIAEENAGVISKVDTQDLFENLTWMLDNGSKCLEMAERGKQLVEQKFNIEVVGQSFLDEYAQLLKK